MSYHPPRYPIKTAENRLSKFPLYTRFTGKSLLYWIDTHLTALQAYKPQKQRENNVFVSFDATESLHHLTSKTPLIALDVRNGTELLSLKNVYIRGILGG